MTCIKKLLNRVIAAALLFFTSLTSFLSLHQEGSPVIYVAFVISHSHSNAAHFGEVKGLIVLMVVRSDPANPHTRGFLPGKDPHRIVILKNIIGKYRGEKMVKEKNKIIITHARLNTA